MFDNVYVFYFDVIHEELEFFEENNYFQKPLILWITFRILEEENKKAILK